MNKIDRRNQGLLSEIEFDLLAQNQGLICSRPILDIGYDRIVDNGKNLLKVQIKSRSFLDRDNSVIIPVGRIDTNRKTKGFKKGEIDIFAVHLIEPDVWFFLPFDKIQGKRIVRLTFNHKKITSLSNDKYLNNWSIFKNELVK